MKVKNLSDNPEYFDKVISLIEASFGYDEDNAFEVDFYPLINKDNFKNCWLLLDKEKIVGHIGVRITELNNGSSFAMMGGIAIDEQYRGKGLFSDFFNQIIDHYNELDFIMLWSDQHELYQKFGFELTGTQYTLLKVDGLQSTFEKVRNLDHNTKEQIESLYRNLSRGELTIKRTKKDWDNLWNIKSTNLYIAKEKNDILSYFFMNKGQDLSGIIHEAYFHTDHHLEAAVTMGTLWLPHQYEPYAEFEENLGLVKFNKPQDISKLWISGLDSI